jgi:hypothetical protein
MVPFNPSFSYKWMNSAIILKLVHDTSYASSKLNPVTTDATNRVKWRLTQYALPLDAVLAVADEDEDVIGGNGIVRPTDRDIRIWDYLCLVNGSLKFEDYDALSYRRIYNPALNKAFARPCTFCTVLMLQKLQHDERDNCGRFVQKRKGRKRHQELRKSQEESSSVLCRITAAVFMQRRGCSQTSLESKTSYTLTLCWTGYLLSSLFYIKVCGPARKSAPDSSRMPIF